MAINTAQAVFSTLELFRRRSAAGQPFLTFLDVPTLSCEVYSLAAGAVDLQMPHADDEIYYVCRGEAKIRIAEVDHEVTAGDVIYVPAGERHFFHEITSDLDLLVFFSKAHLS